MPYVGIDVRLQYLDLDEIFSVAGNIPADLIRNTTNTTHPGFTGEAFWTEYVAILRRGFVARTSTCSSIRALILT